ncbi:MAG TPA: enoyl-CoA hydratase-related protein, partial [Casimicrobiaceae bacterium]|nr:enoyl-CoA hydratase-related protein [Casimicrobiaceae bacterium]
GGYELALACDEILLVDDRTSSVSLPEVPLLGVLPGTGGLTRLIDKRKVRHDRADIFCTTTEGVRGQRAKDWGLVDHIVKPASFAQVVHERARELAGSVGPVAHAQGIELPTLERRDDAHGLHYAYVDVAIDRARRVATFTVQSPAQSPPTSIDDIMTEGAAWWPLAVARELDDAILCMRTNELDIGTWLLKTRGEAMHVLTADEGLARNADHWLVRETIGMLRRTLARLEVSSRTLFALIEPGSCFVGTLFELALAADRAYMLALPGDAEREPRIELSSMNFGAYPMVNGRSRLATRFHGDDKVLDDAQATIGKALTPADAERRGLITAAPDDLDWPDEIRLAIEERASLSPDALSGMEANLRFGAHETMHTRIFGRLSAWQNWIFQRPNAVGDNGALHVYGTGQKPQFDWKRV